MSQCPTSINQISWYRKGVTDCNDHTGNLYIKHLIYKRISYFHKNILEYCTENWLKKDKLIQFF